jgi:hypothetical protein
LPEAMHPFVVHQPAFPAQQSVGHPPAPADVLGCDLAEATPQLGLLDACDLAPMALGAAVLAHHPASKPLRHPEQGPLGINSPAAPLRVQKLPSASSYGCAGHATRASPSAARLLPKAA